jgi:thioredoxin-like negative regulator of GroEL
VKPPRGRGPAGAIRRAAIVGAAVLWLGACAGQAPPSETPLPAAAPSVPSAEAKTAGIAEEIRGLVESGSPPELLRALDLIRSRDLGGTEYGRAMAAVAVTLFKKLYPEIPADLPTPDPPPGHAYTRLLKDAERGAYTPSAAGSTDFLEIVLPFLALLAETRPERFASALTDLDRAVALNGGSTLEPYFRGLATERRADFPAALAAYQTAASRSPDCYPAVVGAARLLTRAGQAPAAVKLLADLVVRYPDNQTVKRELARAYYAAGDWSHAGPAIAEILQRDSKDATFLLMRARVLVETGNFTQAQPLLDAVATVDAADRLYLLLRARVQAEGYRNPDSAITYLRSILRTNPDDMEAAAYAARLLLETGRPDDVAEGRSLVSRLVVSGGASLDIIELSLKDAISRQAWAEAEPLVRRLRAERDTVADLKYAYQVYSGLGDAAGALDAADELQIRQPDDAVAAAYYASSLIAAGRRDEAAAFIDGRLPLMAGGSAKSRFFYLRSLLKTDEEARLGDLRSSLFEDPRNLDALIAMLEFYRSRKDDRRAVYYLKQALALAPDLPLLATYKTEYAAQLAN